MDDGPGEELHRGFEVREVVGRAGGLAEAQEVDGDHAEVFHQFYGLLGGLVGSVGFVNFCFVILGVVGSFIYWVFFVIKETVCKLGNIAFD